MQIHTLRPGANAARQPGEGATAIPTGHGVWPVPGFSSGAGHSQSAALKFDHGTGRVVGELEPVVAAEVVEAFPGDEVLGRAGREQEVFLGKLAKYPAAFGPGPGSEGVRLASGGSVQ